MTTSAKTQSQNTNNNTNESKFYSPRYDMMVTKAEFELLQQTDRRDQLDKEASASYVLAQLDQQADTTWRGDDQHYAIINTSAGSEDLRAIKRACYGNTEAMAFIADNASLWDEPVERKPLVNKDGRFSRRGNTIRTTKVKKTSAPSVTYMPVKSGSQFFVSHAPMGSLRCAKTERWAEAMISLIRSGNIVNGQQLFKAVKSTQDKAVYGTKSRTYELCQQIWHVWHQRKATIAVARFLNALSK